MKRWEQNTNGGSHQVCLALGVANVGLLKVSRFLNLQKKYFEGFVKYVDQSWSMVTLLS